MKHISTGDLVMVAIILSSVSAMLYILFKARMERLTERELIVQQVMESGLYDGQRATDDGFIFRYLWRLSYIIERGRSLGYVLKIQDCYKIVIDIKKNFDPTVGINDFVIDMHIHGYIKQRSIN
jgi:hypothetical protein